MTTNTNQASDLKGRSMPVGEQTYPLNVVVTPASTVTAFVVPPNVFAVLVTSDAVGDLCYGCVETGTTPLAGDPAGTNAGLGVGVAGEFLPMFGVRAGSNLLLESAAGASTFTILCYAGVLA